MSEQARIHRYFPGTNTGCGFVSFFPSLLTGMERIFVLKGAPGTGKSTLLKSIGLSMLDRGFNVEYMHCSGDTNSLDGVIIPEIKVAIVDGSTPHTYEPKAPGVIEELVNLGECWDEQSLQQARVEIIDYNHQMDQMFSEVHNKLKGVAGIREEIRKAYAREIDSEKLNELGDELLEEIFTQKPVARHLFASAITPRGRINFLLNITEPWSRRYILKGLPGSGKSALTQRIADTATERGLKVDLYHDPVEVERIEAVVVPQLDLAVVNLEPDDCLDNLRAEDRIIDFADYQDKDKIERALIGTLVTRQRYTDLMQEAVEQLSKIKEVNDRLETYYVKAMNFEAVDGLKEAILNKILATAVSVRNARGSKV